MAATPRSGHAIVDRDAWREPAVRHALAHLALPRDRLVRIVDVCTMRRDEAWVAVEVDGHQIVVGLRREPCATGGTDATSDGWFRLLYLYETAPVRAGIDTAVPGAR